LRGATEGITRAADLAGARRRFTGSHLIGKPGEPFPDVSWLFDNPDPVRTDAWALEVRGRVREPFLTSYAELSATPLTRQRATIDCTGGWYSEQEWEGVRVGTLLDRAGVGDDARSIIVRSVSGYSRAYPIAEARRLLLAIRVAGAPLSHGHGYPARVVAPGRRGYWWVKWVRTIEASPAPTWFQPPVPLK
jgi:DMSO/TMAO reductase YedYZ molybdopterin-dependent catalytic subunit